MASPASGQVQPGDYVNIGTNLINVVAAAERLP